MSNIVQLSNAELRGRGYTNYREKIALISIYHHISSNHPIAEVKGEYIQTREEIAMLLPLILYIH